MARSPDRPCIHVVDDDPGMRGALTLTLELEGYRVREFASGVDLLGAVPPLEGGCVVMDVRMPGMDGAEVQAALAQSRPDLAVILITGDGDIPLAVRTLKAGAVDFLEKPLEPEVLLCSVALALSSGPVSADTEEAMAKLRLLTARERQVLNRLIAGNTSKEIARMFAGSPRTVEIHRARVLAKLGARNVAEAVRIALSAGSPDRIETSALRVSPRRADQSLKALAKKSDIGLTT